MLYLSDIYRARGMSNLWNKQYQPIRVRNFTEPVGPTCILPGTVLDIFLCFFTEELLEIITHESNAYAAECMDDEAFSNWTKITVQELKAYFGFYILMGLVQLPSMFDYWSTNPAYRYSVISDRITRDRFFELHRYLHFVSNSTLHPHGSDLYDRLGKVRPVIDYLNNRFSTMYNPHCEVSIDEAMVKYKGRSSMKQYMPQKPIKRGFKVWVRADARNGYVSQVDVYAGKVNDKGEKGLGRHVVEKLTQALIGKHHHIYFDNYFTSIQLLLSLRSNGLYGCGTFRSNRLGFPTEFKSKMKKGLENRGDHLALQKDNMSIYLWQDTKPVVVVSSNAQSTSTTTVQRKQRDGSSNQVSCPNAISMYNKYMGGVDMNDQLRNYYNYSFKSRKYYKYIFVFLFHLSITNSFILARHFSTSVSVRNIKQYREKLAFALIGTYNSRKRARRLSCVVPTPVKQPALSHFPRKGSDSVHRCYYCAHTLKQRKQTTWHCRECDVFLCHKGTDKDCFYLYHSTLQ